MDEHYLGDGLYASFDGEFVGLRAPRADGDHTVYLDAQVLAKFEQWIASVRAAYPHHMIAKK
jgi:hypothetical protein